MATVTIYYKNGSTQTINNVDDDVERVETKL